MPYVYRIELPRESGSFQLSVGGIPDVVLSQWSGGAGAPAFHGLDLTGQLEPIDAVTDRLHVARDHHQMFLAAGWSPVSTDETGSFSFTTAAEAEILLPCETGGCTDLELQLWISEEGSSVGLAINGQPLARQPLRPGWNSYRWSVPATALVVGTNSVRIQPDHAIRLGDMLIESRKRPPRSALSVPRRNGEIAAGM
jgi:hypothetical protein